MGPRCRCLSGLLQPVESRYGDRRASPPRPQSIEFCASDVVLVCISNMDDNWQDKNRSYKVAPV